MLRCARAAGRPCHGWGFVGALLATKAVSYGVRHCAFIVFMPLQADSRWPRVAVPRVFSLALLESCLALAALAVLRAREGRRVAA